MGTSNAFPVPVNLICTSTHGHFRCSTANSTDDILCTRVNEITSLFLEAIDDNDNDNENYKVYSQN